MSLQVFLSNGDRPDEWSASSLSFRRDTVVSRSAAGTISHVLSMLSFLTNGRRNGDPSLSSSSATAARQILWSSNIRGWTWPASTSWMATEWLWSDGRTTCEGISLDGSGLPELGLSFVRTYLVVCLRPLCQNHPLRNFWYKNAQHGQGDLKEYLLASRDASYPRSRTGAWCRLSMTRSPPLLHRIATCFLSCVLKFLSVNWTFLYL